MKRFSPILFIATGMCLLLGGFVYDLMFAGIPYQDPTPEMAASYARHAHIASAIRWVGLGIMLVGCVLGIVRRVCTRPHQSDAS